MDGVPTGLSPHPPPMSTSTNIAVKQVPPLQNDPFAVLVSADSRTSSPFNQLQSNHMSISSPSSLLDLGHPSSSPKAQATVSKAPGDDEWTFTSALPEETLPSSSQLQILNSSIKVEFVSRRIPGEKRIQVLVQFSNNTPLPITELHFQVAIEKVGILLRM